MSGHVSWRQVQARRGAQAVIQRIAHDPGDPQITSHCPFCGSGQIVGRSDSNIECEFCGMVYLVRVQPMFTGMPGNPMGGGFGGDTSAAPDLMAPEMLGPDGEPMMSDDVPPEMLDPSMMGPDGLPLEGDGGVGGVMDAEDGEGEPGDDEEDGEDGGGPPWAGSEAEEEGDGGESSGKEKGSGKSSDKGSDSTPPKKKKTKKESSRHYRTIAGDDLPEDAYIRHLAVLHGGIEVVRRQAHVFNGLPWDDPQHLVDKHGWGELDARQMTPEERGQVHREDHGDPFAHLAPPAACRFCPDTFMTPYLATMHERAAHPVESGETGLSQSDKDWLGGHGIEARRRAS